MDTWLRRHPERDVLAAVGHGGAAAGSRRVAEPGQRVDELLDAARRDVAGAAGGQVDRSDAAGVNRGGGGGAGLPVGSAMVTVGAEV